MAEGSDFVKIGISLDIKIILILIAFIFSSDFYQTI